MNLSIWMFNDIVIVKSKEVVLRLCRSNRNFELRWVNLYGLTSSVKSFQKIAQRVEFSFGHIYFFLGDITLLCL